MRLLRGYAAATHFYACVRYTVQKSVIDGTSVRAMLVAAAVVRREGFDDEVEAERGVRRRRVCAGRESGNCPYDHQ
jgi:hypothetical protein